jgi:hypothetical protein
MAKEFALEQTLWHRAAIQFYQDPPAARAMLVNRAGDQFFAGAAFASDQHGGVCWRNQFDLLHHFAQPVTCADDVAEVLFGADFRETDSAPRLVQQGGQPRDLVSDGRKDS